MKASVTSTDKLKLRNRAGSRFASMNASISGWSTRRHPIIAPRRWPAECTVRHIESQQSMKVRGPEASAATPLTGLPHGRIVEKSIPTPPPCCMVSAACFRCSKIPSRLSGIVPMTKQLKRVTARSVPAPARTRPAGMNRKSSTASRNRASQVERVSGASAAAMALATRWAVAAKLSSPEPSSVLNRYFEVQISSANATSKLISTSTYCGFAHIIAQDVPQ